MACGGTAVEPLIGKLLDYLHPEEGEQSDTGSISLIIKALAKIGERACQPVCKLLFDQEPNVVAAAQNCVLQMGSLAVPYLVHLLNDSQQENDCILLVDLLHKIGDEKASKALVQKLLSAAPRCQKMCAEALAAFGGEISAQELVRAQQIVIQHTQWNMAQPGYDERKVEIAKRQLGYINAL